jgi:uncharacterized protein (TIGR00369 family)
MSPINAPDQEKHQLNGFMHNIGGRLTKWEPDHAVIELDVAELHRNGIGVVHGGVMASLIDTVGARAGVFCSVAGNIRQAMTISMNVNLVGNIKEGALIAEARVRKAGKTIFVSSCDVHDQDGNLLATGEVVGRYGRGSHLPQGIPASESSPSGKQS